MSHFSIGWCPSKRKQSPLLSPGLKHTIYKEISSGETLADRARFSNFITLSVGVSPNEINSPLFDYARTYNPYEQVSSVGTAVDRFLVSKENNCFSFIFFH
jgi:hypothetical protein